ncbi:hypothetical protein ASPWEDRAFT_126211, partial [Aspergillus wentii DTO 134E9]
SPCIIRLIFNLSIHFLYLSYVIISSTVIPPCQTSKRSLSSVPALLALSLLFVSTKP